MPKLRGFKYRELKTSRGYSVQGPTSEDDTVIMTVPGNSHYYGDVDIELSMDDLISLLEMYTKAETWE